MEENTTGQAAEQAKEQPTKRQEAKKGNASSKKSAAKTTAASGSSALRSVGKAILARHNYKAIYVTADGAAFPQEGDAKNHAVDLASKEILKVEKE